MIAPIAASLITSKASSLIQSVASSLINTITGKGVIRAGKGQEGGFLPSLVLPLMIKAITSSLGKESQEQEENIIT